MVEYFLSMYWSLTSTLSIAENKMTAAITITKSLESFGHHF